MGVLREVAEADLSVYLEHQRDPGTAAHVGFRSSDRDAYMAHWAKALGNPSVLTRTIVCGGVVAGNIGCWETDGRTLVGYWVGREFRGRGLATRALAEFLSIVDMRPLHAYAGKGNLASIRVLEKCGFVEVGERARDEGIDELVFALESS